MKKLIAAILAAATLFVNAAAVPDDLWQEDKRVEDIFLSGGTAKEYDIIQRLLDYIGVLDTESLNRTEPTDKTAFLKGFGTIVFGDTADGETVQKGLEELGIIAAGTNLSKPTQNDAIYAAGRISGHIRRGTSFNDGLNAARRNGILRNITFRDGEKITQGEFAQILYNTVSTELAEPDYYVTGYHESWQRSSRGSLLELRYGIVLKRGIVTSIYGESLYPSNRIEEDEICIDDISYKCSADAIREQVIGREVNFFVETEENTVILAELTDKNKVQSFSCAEEVEMRTGSIEFDDEKRITYTISSRARLLYNGVFVGTYEKGLADRYYTDGSSLTIIDNDGSGGYDVVMIEKYLSYPIAEAGADGTVRFKYDMEYGGKRFFETMPDDPKTHVILTKNGAAVSAEDIQTNGIISIAENISGAAVTYTKARLDMQRVTGKLESIKKGNIYRIDGTEYRVSPLLLEAQKNYYEIEQPQAGKEYTFIIDGAGLVADVDYSRGYSFGYLIKAGSEEKIDGSTATLKIFTEDGEMKLFGLVKKPVIHTGGDTEGAVMTHSEAVNAIRGSSADYRTLIRYETNGKDEVKELWLPYYNTTGEIGKIEYPLTEDFTAPTNSNYYYGVLAHKYLCTGIPVFAVPKDKDSDDSYYVIRKMDYRGNSVQTNEACTLYSIDKYYKAQAAVMMSDNTSAFSAYQNWIVVDTVGMSANADGDIQCTVSGWQNGAMTDVSADDLSIEAYSEGMWYDGVRLGDLVSGDIIEARQAAGKITDFRVIFRPGDPREPRIQNGTGKTVNWGSGHWALSMTYGKLNAKHDDILMVDISGEVRPHYVHTNVAYYLINPDRSTLRKISASEIHEGDSVVLQKNWGKVRNVFIYRED